MGVRLLYENEATLQTEVEISTVLAQRWRCELRKLPIKYQIDYIAFRGEPCGLVEVRDRPEWTYQRFATSGGYLVSVCKVERMVSLSSLLAVKSVLVVRCAKGREIYSCQIGPSAPGPVSWFNGNTISRRDADREPCFMIPMEKFSRVIMGERA